MRVSDDFERGSALHTSYAMLSESYEVSIYSERHTSVLKMLPRVS